LLRGSSLRFFMSNKKNGENSRGVLCQFMRVLLFLD
jgi:hypothetical protein